MSDKMHTAVDEYLDEVLGKSGGNERHKTYTAYKDSLRGKWLPFCEANGVNEPGHATDKVMARFEGYLRQGAGRGGHGQVSPHSVRSRYRAARTFLNWCEVPRGKAKLPKVPKRRMVVLTRQEIDAMERAADTERDKLIVRVLADSGLRAAEFLSLTQESLRVNPRTRQTELWVTGKGDKDREVPLPAKVFERLRRYAQAHAADGGPIFRSLRRRNGKFEPLTVSGLGQIVRFLASEAKISKRVHVHGFRHAYITFLVEQDVDLVTIRDVVGHVDISLIAEVYTHTTAQNRFAKVAAALA